MLRKAVATSGTLSRVSGPIAKHRLHSLIQQQQQQLYTIGQNHTKNKFNSLCRLHARRLRRNPPKPQCVAFIAGGECLDLHALLDPKEIFTHSPTPPSRA